MSGFFKSCVDRYLELAKKSESSLRQVASPFLDEACKVVDDEESGELQPIAARVLMKVLYGARMCRYDLLRPTCYLATRIATWTRGCDRALNRLMAYISCTLHLRMLAWVGDVLSKWEYVVYSDADLAGDTQTSRSATGVFTCVRAPTPSRPCPGHHEGRLV